MEKNSFVLYTEYGEVLAALSDAEVGKLMRAVFAYAERGEVVPLPRVLQTAFLFMQKQIERDVHKWEQARNQRVEAGRKGGKARAQKQQQKGAGVAEAFLGEAPAAAQPAQNNTQKKASAKQGEVSPAAIAPGATQAAPPQVQPKAKCANPNGGEALQHAKQPQAALSGANASQANQAVYVDGTVDVDVDVDENENEGVIHSGHRGKNKGQGRRAAFTPPLLSQIKTYCAKQKNKVDAQAFFDYYTANGWRIGQNPMQDWQAAVRRWGRMEKSLPMAQSYGGKGKIKPMISDIAERNYTEAELNSLLADPFEGLVLAQTDSGGAKLGIGDEKT